MAQPFGIVPIDTVRKMPGLDILNAIIAGDLPTPPIADLLKFRLTEAGPGRAVFTGTPAFDHYNIMGTVHGGYIATMLDSCMTCAVMSLAPVGTGLTTLEFKVSFIRAVTDTTGVVRAEGTAINVGRRVGTAEGKLIDSKGRLLAHATTTCLLMELPAEISPKP